MSNEPMPPVIPSKIGREFMRKYLATPRPKLTVEQMRAQVKAHQESARLNLLKFEHGAKKPAEER